MSNSANNLGSNQVCNGLNYEKGLLTTVNMLILHVIYNLLTSIIGNKLRGIRRNAPLIYFKCFLKENVLIACISVLLMYSICFAAWFGH